MTRAGYPAFFAQRRRQCRVHHRPYHIVRAERWFPQPPGPLRWQRTSGGEARSAIAPAAGLAPVPLPLPVPVPGPPAASGGSGCDAPGGRGRNGSGRAPRRSVKLYSPISATTALLPSNDNGHPLGLLVHGARKRSLRAGELVVQGAANDSLLVQGELHESCRCRFAPSLFRPRTRPAAATPRSGRVWPEAAISLAWA